MQDIFYAVTQINTLFQGITSVQKISLYEFSERSSLLEKYQ